MPEADSPPARRRALTFAGIALLIASADQALKAWVRSYPEGQVIFQGGFFRLVHVQNTGAAFGIFPGQFLVFTVVGVIGLMAMLAGAVVVYRRYPHLATLPRVLAFGLVLGGTAGNLADRLHIGHVTDFFDVGWWPAFNLADASISLGAVLVAALVLWQVLRQKHAPPAPGSRAGP